MIKIYGKNCIYEAIFAKAKMELFIEDNQTKKDKNILSLLQDKGYKYKVLTKKKWILNLDLLIKDMEL